MRDPAQTLVCLQWLANRKRDFINPTIWEQDDTPFNAFPETEPVTGDSA